MSQDFSKDTTSFDRDCDSTPYIDFTQKPNQIKRWQQERMLLDHTSPCLLHSSGQAGKGKKRSRHGGTLPVCTCLRIPGCLPGFQSNYPRPLMNAPICPLPQMGAPPFMPVRLRNIGPGKPIPYVPVMEAGPTKPRPLMAGTEYDQSTAPIANRGNFQEEITDILQFWRRYYRPAMDHDSQCNRVSIRTTYNHYISEYVNVVGTNEFCRISLLLGIKDKQFVIKTKFGSLLPPFDWEVQWKTGVIVKILIERFWSYNAKMDLGEAYSKYCTQICHSIHEGANVSEDKFRTISGELGYPSDTNKRLRIAADTNAEKKEKQETLPDAGTSTTDSHATPSKKLCADKTMDNQVVGIGYIKSQAVEPSLLESNFEANPVLYCDDTSSSSSVSIETEPSAQTVPVRKGFQPSINFTQLMNKFDKLEKNLLSSYDSIFKIS